MKSVYVETRREYAAKEKTTEASASFGAYWVPVFLCLCYPVAFRVSWGGEISYRSDRFHASQAVAASLGQSP
ncbi:MAG: hypothetical protein VXX11_02115 [Planctomycetota bacterium]|nr:hypothetical protein [Planctomycetota bacterium]